VLDDLRRDHEVEAKVGLLEHVDEVRLVVQLHDVADPDAADLAKCLHVLVVDAATRAEDHHAQRPPTEDPHTHLRHAELAAGLLVSADPRSERELRERLVLGTWCSR